MQPSKIFFIADCHFGHSNMLNFVDDLGNKIRPFNSVDEMDNKIVSNWNSVVSPSDRIYCLGDMVINRKNLSILGKLNGRKKLIIGNHDIFKTEEYLQYFDQIVGTFKYKDFILSHVPIHPDSIPKWCKLNIHGHLHQNKVMKEIIYRSDISDYDTLVQIPDKRYFCVSVEQINYTPISIDELVDKSYW